MIRLTFIPVFLLSWNLASAQEWKELGVDDLFELARKEAFDGQREEAREKLRYILEKSPGYADVRILLARTHAWDGDRATARKELQVVLSNDPKYQDALNALIDVEMWDDQPKQALEIVNVGLKYYPTFGDFLYKKAKLLNDTQQPEEAMSIVNQFIRLYPAEKRGIDLRETIKVGQQRWTAGVRISEDYFSKPPSQYAFYSSAQIGRSNDWGSSIVRLNYANRFDLNGLQPEIDLYPTVAPKMYAYLNYGFSSTDLFPKHRFGAELYRSFPLSIEGSIGLRHMIFNNSVTIYTGSLGWYHKSMWFSFRPFITPDKTTGTSMSGSLTARRYFGNPNTYLEASGGIGYSPEIRQLQSSTGVSTEDIYVLQSQRIGVGFQLQMKYNLISGINLNISNQERVSDYMLIFNGAVYVNYLF